MTGSSSLKTNAEEKSTGSPLSDQQREALGHAINALFRMLEDAYPHRFRSAFPKDEDYVRAKRVWENVLKEFSPRRIMLAGKKAISSSSKYMPDLAGIRALCQPSFDEMGLKEPLQAYYEACRAPVRTREYSWSHLAVYLAARETGWLTLSAQEQRIAYPVFERNYSIICNRVLDGEDLEATIALGIEDSRTKALFRQADEAADQSQRQLMAEQGIDPDNGKAAREKLKLALKT
ncbi:replication protein P [Candidatus Sororendozoicomonas aggregata]|uniref:replication protein P n=1 Tax=Candidatus Sororendozoicomonas aggregata TaxID=3073239 RepID=UPI002ED29C4A